MAISLRHSFVSARADGSDSGLVQPSNWNSEHTITIGAAKLLGREAASDGAAQEITLGTGLSLSGTTLNASISGGGGLLAANNLSDVASAATARTNLGLVTVAATGAYSDLSGTPSLATVATSGLYSDLSGTPTLGSAAALSTADVDERAVDAVGAAIVAGPGMAFAYDDTANTLTFSATSTSGAPSGLVSGGQVVWESGYVFRVSAAEYVIDGVYYTSAEQTVTLAAADATNDRIDVIYLDTAGLADKITGTAAALPTEPDIDPSTQIKLTFVQVPATTTEPATITVTNIYLENTEWTSATSGSGFNANSTNNPYAGTKCIEGTTVTNGSYVSLVAGAPLTLDSATVLAMFIRSKATWASGRVLRAQWYSSGVAKGVPVTIASGYWGYDSSITSGYQQIAIPISQFVVPLGTSVDRLRITDSGGSIGFYIDNIKLQAQGTGLSQGGTSYLTKAQADAYYSPLGAYAPGGTDVALADGGTGASLSDPGADRIMFWDDSAGAVTWLQLGAGLAIATTTLRNIETFQVAMSDMTTALTTGDGKAGWVVPYDCTLLEVFTSLTAAQSSSGAVTIDARLGNTGSFATIFSAAPSIAASKDTNLETGGTAATLSTTAATKGQLILFDIDAAGTGAKGLIVTVSVRRT